MKDLYYYSVLGALSIGLAFMFYVVYIELQGVGFR